MTNDQNIGADELLKLMAEETAMAHGGLRAYFELVEKVLNNGDLKTGAKLLDAMIQRTREHLSREEALGRDAGLSSVDLRHLHHDAMVERVRLLRAQCLTPARSSELAHKIEIELVGFLSDLVENDIRAEQALRSISVANDP